jgi:2-polyprenyl-6-methoxyphenol hydroxylase-like FAD-dependent oxidoreductase
VHLGDSVRELLTDGTRVTGVKTARGEYPARLVIGADGRNSRVARLVNAPKYIDMPPATYSYFALWEDCGVSELWSFWDDYLTILIPTNDDLTLVFFQGPHAAFDGARHSPTEGYLGILKSRPAVMDFLLGASMAESAGFGLVPGDQLVQAFFGLSGLMDLMDPPRGR